MPGAFRKTLDYARRNGIAAACAAARERLADQKIPYTYDAPAKEELDRQRHASEEEMRAGTSPRISVVVPCYRTPKAYLEAMRASVEAQSYRNFELILTEEPGGIAANTNAGIARATGDYIALLDHDDLLAPDALYHMVQALKDAREKGITPYLVYSDEDKVQDDPENGGLTFFAPNRKPDYNYDYLLSNNYICHFTMVEAGLLKRLGLRSEYDGAQDHDLFLRIAQEALREADGDFAASDAWFVHVPRVLYHWRAAETSTAASGANKSYAHEAGRRAVRDHLKERGINCAVEELPHRGFLRVHYFDDLFAQRPDLGAVGGRLVDRRGRTVGGLYTAEGEILFDGLPRGFSGGFNHRAVCQQDAEAVDLTNMRIRPELVSRIPAELKPWLSFRTEDFSDRSGRVQKSLLVCEEIRRMGYRILWDPMQTKVVR